MIKFYFDPIAQLIFADVLLLLSLYVIADDSLTLEAFEDDNAIPAIENDLKEFENWIHPSRKLIKIHIFNYTNIDRFMSGLDDVIKVKDIGPYVYSEISDKVQLTFNDDDKITFRENRTQFFEKKLSGKLKEEDILIVPNIPLLSAISSAADGSFILRIGLNHLIAMSSPEDFHKLTAHDYMFGYKDHFINALENVNSHVLPHAKNFGVIAEMRGLSKYKTTINMRDNEIKAINGKSMMGIWEKQECNHISGSDGSKFNPMLIDDGKELKFFAKDLCRSFPLIFEKEVETLKGESALRFKIERDSLETSECYCARSDHKKCPPNGILDISSCPASQLPFLISYPHFLEGDALLFEHFEGLSPNPELHSTSFDINPQSGITESSAIRFQYNIKVRSLANHGHRYKNIPAEIILPICWLEIES